MLRALQEGIHRGTGAFNISLVNSSLGLNLATVGVVSPLSVNISDLATLGLIRARDFSL